MCTCKRAPGNHNICTVCNLPSVTDISRSTGLYVMDYHTGVLEMLETNFHLVTLFCGLSILREILTILTGNRPEIHRK